MKQAFTNTTNKKTFGKPLFLKPNAKGKTSNGKRSGQRAGMPECKYGAACAFKSSCVYSHTKTKAQAKSENICMPFVAGYCEYGDRCFNIHPSQEKINEMKATLANKPCKFGLSCQSREVCLFNHPEIPEQVLDTNAAPFVPFAAQQEFAYNFQTPLFPVNNLDTSAKKTPTRRNRVKIPQDIWIDKTQRSAVAAMSYKDPLERFFFVNRHFNSTPIIFDLHFQTLESFQVVLNSLLKKDTTSCWIITGSGHHVQPGQKQVANSVGVLFNAVNAYLEEHGFEFQVGVDVNGHLSAFLVN